MTRPGCISMEQTSMDKLKSNVAGSIIPIRNSTPPQSKANWRMPEVGVKISRKKAPKVANSRDTSSSGSFKTSKLARALGEIAVANDLAYIPRIAEDAVVGINSDQNHSRESYVEAHHAAIDFTRQLPRGIKAGLFNPSTHMLVPLSEGKQAHTMNSLPADSLRGTFPDLLDSEFMTNKPRTMPDLRYIEATRNTCASVLPDVPSPPQLMSLFQAPEQFALTEELPQALQAGMRTEQQQEKAVSTGKSSMPVPIYRIPTQLKVGQQRREERHSAVPQPPNFLAIQNTFLNSRRRTPPKTLQTEEADIRPDVRAPLPYSSSRPSRTWDDAIGRRHREPREELHASLPTKPATIHNLYEPYRPATPPLIFDYVSTFGISPGNAMPDPNALTRSDSSRQRKEWRQTGVHRQKTSKDIWDERLEALIATERGQAQDEQQQPIDPQADGREEEEGKRTRHGEFVRQHREKLQAMKDQIAATDDRRAQQERDRQAREAKRCLRPIARTFDEQADKHYIRTRTMRISAKTFEEGVKEHHLRPSRGRRTITRTTEDVEADSLQKKTERMRIEVDAALTQREQEASESPPFRFWQPNTNYRNL